VNEATLRKISEQTRKRCKIETFDAKMAKLFQPVSLELFHFFFEVDKISFPIYFRIEDCLIEFIKPEEFSKVLLKQLWGSLLKPGHQAEFCIRKSDHAALSALFDQIRQAKLKRVLTADPGLDPKIVEVFGKVSYVSQMVVRGGLNPSVISAVGQSAEFLVDNIFSSERVVTTISKMVAIDPTLYDHSASVAMMAAIIGSRFLPQKLTKKEARLAAECGLYHDVGKTCVPSAILNKPGKFTPEEYTIMKTHAELGEQEIKGLIAKGSPIDPLCARVAGEHHEDFCGSGYPRGRKGKFEDDPQNGIHLMTRIVTIADVYSALLMKRVYKESYETGEALKVMNDCSAKFDPEIFSAFVSEVVKSLNEEGDGADHGRILQVVKGKLQVFGS
jgi:HD-GYP domain-containing protein (c-di-GMP phosphodiesterase class II)